MAMTVAEARTEIKSMYEQADVIEKRYPDGPITKQEDENEVKRLLTEIDGLELKLAGLEDAETRRARIMGGLDRYTKAAPGATRPGQQAGEQNDGVFISPGDQFLQSREYRELKLNGSFNSALSRVTFAINLKDGSSLVQWGKRSQAEQKALLRGGSASSGGGWVQNDVQPGYIEIVQRDIVLLDLIPRIQTESDTIEYVKEDTFTNAAAAVAEASATTGTSGAKPESTLAYSVATSPVRTIAHWIPVTNRMLADAPAIRGIINGRLLLGLDLVLESEVVTGAGTGEHLSGILGSGTNLIVSGAYSVLDRMFMGRTAVRVTGHGRPNAYVMHPNDWQGIRLARENAATGTLGSYLMGPPSQSGPMVVWGLPVVESEAETENTALCGDFAQGCALFDREQGAIRVGTINDQFTRNMQTILAELRAAFIVYRPTMFSRITGV